MHPYFETVDPINEEETSTEFWYNKAQDILKNKLEQKINNNTAKNIIFFIGDGMDFQVDSSHIKIKLTLSKN